jgi:hypothetical protein
MTYPCPCGHSSPTFRALVAHDEAQHGDREFHGVVMGIYLLTIAVMVGVLLWRSFA